MTTGAGTPSDARLDDAVALFEYLARVQQLKMPQIRTTDTYRDSGAVHWLWELPDHPGVVSASHQSGFDAETPLLTVDRVPRLDPPAPSPQLSRWIEGDWKKPSADPQLLGAITQVIERAQDEFGLDDGAVTVKIDESPDVQAEFRTWRQSWADWAAQESADRPARDFYASLYETYVSVDTHPEELELVLGIGLLGWQASDGSPIRRHLLTAPVIIHLDETSGRLTAEAQRAGFTLETDMLDPGQLTNPAPVMAIRDEVAEVTSHPLDRETVGLAVRRIVHTLSAEGQFLEIDTRPPSGEFPAASFAPTLILRKRSTQGIYEIFQSIVEQLKTTGEVPAGLVPLIDPDHVVEVEHSADAGAVLDVDGDPFLPLPVNDRQLEIIRRVDTSAQVLVQGPPGTGKTHTAAALLSHLLAQGKRVLVTAHTDRALYEVRGKLPETIRPLSVSVIGASQSDMAELKLAVEQISQAASDFDEQASIATETGILQEVDRLKRRRAELYRKLIDAREGETIPHSRHGEDGTLAKMAERHELGAAEFGWITSLAAPQPDTVSPLSSADANALLHLLTDPTVAGDEQDASRALPELSSISTPQDFAEMCRAEARGKDRASEVRALASHGAMKGIRALPAAARKSLQDRVTAIAHEAVDLEQRREAWMNDALADVRAGRAGIWEQRLAQVDELVARASQPISALGPVVQVRIDDVDRGQIRSLAKSLRDFIATGKQIKLAPDGTPKVGAFAPAVIKQSRLIFDSVRVDGVPPTTDEDLAKVELTLEAEQVLNALDRAWPASIAIPEEDTLGERLQWHVTELSQLRRVLALADRLADESTQLQRLGLPSPDWTDLESIIAFASLVDVAATLDALDAAVADLDELLTRLDQALAVDRPAACVAELLDAVGKRDIDMFAQAHARLAHLHQVATHVSIRDAHLDALIRKAPDLASALAATADAPEWRDRFARFEEAWAWAETAAWIRAQDSVDVNVLQAQLADVERQLIGTAGRLAATRAWRHAVSVDRMTGRTRADLTNYSQLVRKLGKGTGKYAAKQRSEIRVAMDRCRSAVPVWIMPIYRIAEQLSVSEDMFDVVIVDEASQAGLEATFLQYIAPRVVVIGDDKQVSPSAVGIDQSRLRDLASQYIPNDRYREQWVNPQRSYFDEAAMRFPKRIVLTEHRRCMPEIIGFSNRVAYEPEGVRLVPVRQYGADRLDPVKAVHLADGYETGRINVPEADAIVDQIEKCIADPAYDNKTFGVISLLGPDQAKAIDRRLLERFGPEQISARELRCGDASDFQGSERDIIFLSMVKAPTPGKRVPALTQSAIVQRFNVAASRAKDQMWLFHSVTPADLSGRADDMRSALIEYCYGVISRVHNAEGADFDAAPEDLLVEPFDSLFEQRVHNRILDRGYTVLKQVEALGYRIDLVVVGANGRLAVECDGDAWHGPAEYERDLKRQRDLERCDWKFFRIRESLFYVDRAKAMQGLWDRLDDLDIRPAGWAPAEVAESTPPEAVDFDQPLLEAEDISMPALDEEPAGEIDETAVPPTHQTLADVTVEIEGHDASGVEAETEVPEYRPPAPSAALEMYAAYVGSVIPVGDATPAELLDGLIKIVQTEGPVLGHRLHRAYVTSAGGQRVGKLIGQEINRALMSALKSGLLVVDDPLNEGGLKPLTFRTPSQPSVRPRTLGPRDFEQIPPGELAALIDSARESGPTADLNSIYRSVLEQLGLKRLTTGVEARLRAVIPLTTLNHSRAD